MTLSHAHRSLRVPLIHLFQLLPSRVLSFPLVDPLGLRRILHLVQWHPLLPLRPFLGIRLSPPSPQSPI